MRLEADLGLLLHRVKAAPLKPQQRLTILRTFLLPRLLYALVLGRTTAGRLASIDRQVRRAVREWVHLPKDTPTAVFHTSVKDGGLGIPAMVTFVPGSLAGRLERLRQSGSPDTRAILGSHAAERRLHWARKQLAGRDLPTERPTAEQRKRHWAQRLYASQDGAALREAGKEGASTAWISRNSNAIPGRDYVQFARTWVNALPTRTRVARGDQGRGRDLRCRAGCEARETSAHIIQSCWRTHGGRILRHDAIVKTLAGALKQKGYNIKIEHLFTTATGRFKPDILAAKDGHAHVLDVQVVAAGPPLQELHQAKKRKYQENQDLTRQVADLMEATTAEVSTLTVSWRGVLCHTSADYLRTMGLSNRILAGVVTRVLQGSHTTWSRFNQTTAAR